VIALKGDCLQFDYVSDSIDGEQQIDPPSVDRILASLLLDNLVWEEHLGVVIQVVLHVFFAHSYLSPLSQDDNESKKAAPEIFSVNTLDTK